LRIDRVARALSYGKHGDDGGTPITMPSMVRIERSLFRLMTGGHAQYAQ